MFSVFLVGVSEARPNMNPRTPGKSRFGILDSITQRLMATPVGAGMLSSKVEEETIDYEPNAEDYFGAEVPPPASGEEIPPFGIDDIGEFGNYGCLLGS